MSKVSIKNVFDAYRATLRDNRDGGAHTVDVITQIVIPVFGSVIYGVLRYLGMAPVGYGGVSDNIINIVSIVSALLCGAAIMLYQLRFDIVSTDLRDFARGDELVLIDELYAGMLWAIAEGFAVAGILTLRGVFRIDALDCVMVSVALCMFVNFCLVLMMCLKRMSASYEFVSKYWSRMPRAERD